MHLFAPLFNLRNELPLSPDDVAFAISQPEFDPLCGLIVTRMLSRKLARLDESDSLPQIKYEQWNEQLGKKIAILHKQYQKFILRHKVAHGEDQETSETDVIENLVKGVTNSARYLNKFYSEHAATFKTELLQTIRLFELHLSGEDPFYIPCESPEQSQRKATNIYES